MIWRLLGFERPRVLLYEWEHASHDWLLRLERGELPSVSWMPDATFAATHYEVRARGDGRLLSKGSFIERRAA